MGGPCKIRQVDAKGTHVGTVKGPDCTDNFQIIEFVFEKNVYYSAEQCFQSQKFKENSLMAVEIQKAKPMENETNHAYGMRVWSMGQSRSSPLRDNYEAEKVKLMFMINLAKYSSNHKLQEELVEKTHNFEIIGAPSTWQWSKWNGLIQMLIRKRIKENNGLKHLLPHYMAMSAKQIETALEDKEEEEDASDEELDDVKEDAKEDDNEVQTDQNAKDVNDKSKIDDVKEDAKEDDNEVQTDQNAKDVNDKSKIDDV
eukprot:209986_1